MAAVGLSAAAAFCAAKSAAAAVSLINAKGYMDKNFEYMQENITERTLYMWVFIPPGPARRKGGGHSFLRRGFVNRSGMCYDGKQRPVRPADWRAFLMGTKEYRMKKMEYYGRPMGALNLYMYLLLPAFVLYSAVTVSYTHLTLPTT